MLRLALRRATSGALNYPPKNPKFAAAAAAAAAAATARLYGTHGPVATQNHSVAGQMIDYALGLARSQKTGESYGQALLVLEQGLSNLRGGVEDACSDDAVGMLMLAMSTLHYERGQFQDCLEKLKKIRQLEHTSFPLRVAAWEGLVGVNLELGQDFSSLVLSDDCFPLRNNLESVMPESDVLSSRVKAIKGLAYLVLGNLKSAEIFFNGCMEDDTEEGKDHRENIVLCRGEFVHCTGNLSMAKGLYEKALQEYKIKDASGMCYLSSANMVPEEIHLGAMCALGQLLSHLGNFSAEEILTEALKMAEDHFGSTHPKVGIVLTCIALMFRHKAKLEASSSILIQEGLYRRAIDLLKAPGLDTEVTGMHVDRQDIVALARGGYAEVLCLQQNRKGEGERMRKWAEAAWKNRRVSLAEALEFSEPSKAAVIDTRICRVL